MIQKTRLASASRAARSLPDSREIRSACRAIRSSWTREQKRQRRVRLHDSDDQRFAAHLRFAEMLVAGLG